MIWISMNIKTSVVKLEVKDITIVVLTRLETELKVNVLFSMKAKTYILNAIPKLNLFSFLNVVSN